MKDTYSSVLELAIDLVSQNTLPDGVKLVSVNEYNQMVFDINVDIKNATVSEIMAISSACNFVDRLMLTYLHKVKKAV